MANHEELKMKVCKISMQIMAEDKKRSEKERVFKDRYVHDLVDMRTAKYTGVNVTYYLNGRFQYTLEWLQYMGKQFNTENVCVAIDHARLKLLINPSHEEIEQLKIEDDEKD